MPEFSVDAKFKRRRNEAAQVVTEDLGENLVHLRVLRLSANARAKLGLDHVKNGFNIRPLMVVRQELLAVIGEELIHTPPQLPATLRHAGPSFPVPIPTPRVVVRLERYQRERACADDSVKVVVAYIRAISGDGLDCEPLCRRFEERG